MNKEINRTLLQIQRRSEKSTPEVLRGTFVDVGMLQALLVSTDHQIIYGRRGTGKTHALNYLAETKRVAGDICIYIDMRTIGSSNGIYADEQVPLAERATRLLRDTLGAVHTGLFDYAIETDEALDLGVVGQYLDAFIDAINETQVVGTVTTEETVGTSAKSENNAGLNVTVGHKPRAVAAFGRKDEVALNNLQKQTLSGNIKNHVRFGAITALFEKINASHPHQVWLLLDEWSAIPNELQPYLADLIRRCLLPVKNLSVKIGAIEQRSKFLIGAANGSYTGIEIGADMTADLNLDDFMVFDFDAEKAVQYFKTLVFNHFYSAWKANKGAQDFSEDQFLQQTFTQRNVFEEIVRAAEGVPRDAINIIIIAAQKADDKPISINHVRDAASIWYRRDKSASVSSNVIADKLLHWIVSEVIAHRKARAFLLASSEKSELIDALFDARVLHLLKRNISSHEDPGVRYDVYKIDYGCYVDLLTTSKAPTGLLPGGTENFSDGSFTEVPPDDYRAIRRAILSLGDFAKSSDPAQGSLDLAV